MEYIILLVISVFSGFIDALSQNSETKNIIIFYKKTCPYSIEALKTLNKLNCDFTAIEKDEDPALIHYVRQTYHPTFPIVFINNRLIGGNSELQSLIKNMPYRGCPA